MAKKVILKDLNNIEVLPITRGELILDASGNLALHSTLFLATDSLPGLMSSEDKYKLDHLEDSGPGANNKVAQINTTTNDVYRLLFSETADDTDRIEGSRKSANLTFNPNTGILNLTGAINANGGTLSGKLTIKTDAWADQLEIFRNSNTGNVFITYSNLEKTLGYIGICGASGTHPYQPCFSNGTSDHKIWHSGNDGSGSGLDADLLDGFHQTDFFKGRGWSNTNLDDFENGIAMTAVTNNESINSPNGYANVVTFTNGQTDYGSVQFVGSKNMLYYRALWDTTWGDWKTVAFTDSNVASATKLQTLRTIWGQLFDGTNNVSGHIYLGANAIFGYNNASVISSTETNLSVGYGQSTNGISLGLYGNEVNMYYGKTGLNRGFILNSSGNITIGSSDLASTNYKLYVDGLTKITSSTNIGLQIDSSYTGAVTRGVQVLNTSVAVGDTNGVALLFGQSTSAYNCGNIAYRHHGENSTSNYVSLGLYGKDNILVCNANGNVGIGTTIPAYKLTVAGEISTWIDDYSAYSLRDTSRSGWQMSYRQKENKELIFYKIAYNDYTTVMALTTSGNVGIGTPTPSTKLHVNGDVLATGGFLKLGSSDSYVLLGGGGHKLVSDFASTSSLGNYLPLAGGTMNNGAIIKFNAAGGLIQTTNTTSNATSIVLWYKGTAKDTNYSHTAQIGWHNTGDTDGAIYIIPNPQNSPPWGGDVGLYIGKTLFKWNNNVILHTGNYTTYLDSRYYTESEADNRFVNVTGDTMTGVLTMNTGTGFQMKYTVGGNDPWMYANGSPNYGIRYFEGTTDKMALSASGNNNNTSTADLCINGNGEGTVTIRGNTILHTGNYTGTLDGRYYTETEVNNLFKNYLPLAGGTMTGGITFSADSAITWSRNTDFASIRFKNTGDGDSDSYMDFQTGDNGNEYIKFSRNSGGTISTVATIKSEGIKTYGYFISELSSRYVQIGPQNSSHAHYQTNADISHWFNKRVDVNGAIWRYNTNYGISSDGYFYAKGMYANRDGSSTGGGVSLYSDSDPMTYGIAFRGTSTYGTHGYVTADWATYFTMNDLNSRGWIFRRGSTNVASIDSSGLLYTNGRINGNYYTSRVATGTLPYACTSTTVNTNLNADLLDGIHASGLFTNLSNSGNNISITIGGTNKTLTPAYATSSGNADTVDNWHRDYFQIGYDGSRHYRVLFALGSQDLAWKTVVKGVSSYTAAPSSNTWQALTIRGNIWYTGNNHCGGELRKYPFLAIFYFVSATSLINTAYLYLPLSAKGYDFIRIVRVSTNNFELLVRLVSDWQCGWIEYQIKGHGGTPYTTLQTASSGTVVVNASSANTLQETTGVLVSDSDSNATYRMVWHSGNSLYSTAGIYCNPSSDYLYATSMQTSNWFRSTGSTGWYSQDYGGGWYMADSSWIRNYNGKPLYMAVSTLPSIVCNAQSGSEANIRFEIAGVNKGYTGYRTGYGTFLWNSTASKYVYINDSGYFYTLSYINVGAGNEKNASNPPYVWGVNGSDNFMRTYATSSLSVGTAATCTGNAKGLYSSGYGNGNLTYYQTDSSFFGNSGWTHYIIANHGDGSNYYNFTLALPFWGVPKYKRLEGGTADGWYTFITTENYTTELDGRYVNLAGDTMTGALTFSLTSSTRRNGIIGTYDPNRAAAIWSMGSSYQIAADGTSFGSLYGAAYAYFGSGYTFGANYTNGHSFVWCQNGTVCVLLGNGIWTSGNCYAAHFYENSDKKLKENIQAILNSDNIPQIKEFNWKESGEHSYGLIAQELEEQGYSELVSETNGVKNVNYSAALSLIVGKLLNKIAELEKEIENLKSKN